MNDVARDRILKRLRESLRDAPQVAASACMAIAPFTDEEKINRLKALMEAVNTQVYVTSKRDWPTAVKSFLRQRDLKTLLYAPETDLGAELQKIWTDDSDGLPQLTTYDGDIEAFKGTLFQTDAAITTTLGAIAETGTLVLWPDTHEPRLMSLVPPIHIAFVEATSIYNSFCEIIQSLNWSKHMPTNALLISGPSKTADIELTLTYGVHGPKELIVFIVT